MNIVGATKPFEPFPYPVGVPAPNPLDAPLICLQVNETWLPYVLGCIQALLADSTWNTTNPVVLRPLQQAVQQWIGQLSLMEMCPLPVQFRVNPTDPHYWDYSNDGGAIWTRQPDTVSHLTPTFTPSGAPSGYDLSVNGGLSSSPVPLMGALTPNDAIVTDPNSLLRNLIVLAAGGPEALIAEVGTQVVMNLVTQGITALFAKNMQVPAFVSDPVVRIDGLGSGAPLLQVNP